MTSSRGLRARVESLLADELWDSAETLGGLLASHAQSRHADAEGVPAGERAACVALFADVLLGKGEHRRAVHHYARALELNRLAPPAGGQTEAETPMGTRPPGTPGPDGSPAAPAPVTPGATAAMTTRETKPGETPATRSGTASSGVVPGATHLDESAAKFKMGKCFAALGEWRFALAELETIPARARTLPVTLALAEAYKRTGYDRASLACYKECLRINPFAVEAVEALADAGVAPPEPPGKIAKRGDDKDAENAAEDAFASDALRLLTRGRVALASGDAVTAASAYAALADTFPGDARVELARARAAAAAGDDDAAAAAFRRRRASDPRAAEGADEFAELLRRRADEGEEGLGSSGDSGDALFRDASSAHDAHDEHGLGGYGVLSASYGLGGATSRGASGELRALVSEALEAAPERPEAWCAAATYWAARGQLARALGYVDKALRLDDRRVGAHVARGHLCLRLRRPDDAVGSFRRAAALCASAAATSEGAGARPLARPSWSARHDAVLASRAGLVAGYLLQRRRKEALAAAKEALALAPGSAMARALVGDAYLARGAQNAPSGASASADARVRAEKARKHFEAALALRPGDSRLALALSEAQRACGESDAAIHTLRSHLEAYAAAETRARVACHCALGAALASARMLADAAGEYQRACGLDAESEPAKRGLARVERLLKGRDPDEGDDVGEDEDDSGRREEDEEGDQEDDEGDLFE